MKITALLIAFVLIISKSQPQNERVVQFDISSLLNARPVTTFANNKLTPWVKGIDGNGLGDGYLTQAAAVFNGDKDAHALPDNPIFAANAQHPEIKLHYSNTDSVSMQAHTFAGEDSAEFAVPKQKYKAIYLALTSAEGATNLQITFTYTDGMTTENLVLPDYYADIKADDPHLCYLAHDLAKWGNKNNMTEKDHHNIDLLKVGTDAKRVLKSITIGKTKPGYLVFWAAAGVTK